MRNTFPITRLDASPGRVGPPLSPPSPTPSTCRAAEFATPIAGIPRWARLPFSSQHDAPAASSASVEPTALAGHGHRRPHRARHRRDCPPSRYACRSPRPAIGGDGIGRLPAAADGGTDRRAVASCTVAEAHDRRWAAGRASDDPDGKYLRILFSQSNRDTMTVWVTIALIYCL